MTAAGTIAVHPTPWPGMPPVKGRLRPNVDLSRSNWFRVGGPAEWLFRPEDAEDLSAFLRAKPRHLPVTVLGVGSNVIIRDGGIDGVVIRLGGRFADAEVKGDTVIAGAACLDVNVARLAQEHGLTGLEFLSGIPGTLGGAVAMNAGAYGREIREVLVEAEAMDEAGNMHALMPQDLQFRYRGSGLPEGWIVTRATLRGAPGEGDAIAARMREIAQARESTQPVRSRTGGSTFKNPSGHKAWELIDAAGCRGLRVGGAQASELHCNFLINEGSATAADLENLGEEVRRRVKEKTGIALEWEIKRIGKP